MTNRNQTEFYLEQLQNDWLPTRRSCNLHRRQLTLLDTLAGNLALLRIQPAEAFNWSWRKASFPLVVGLLSGVLFGLVVGLLFGSISGPLSGPIFGLMFGMIFGLLFGLIGGLTGSALDQQHRLRPNEGIRRSARNALALGLICGVDIAFASGLIYGVFGRLLFDLDVGLLEGLFGVVLGFVLGGLTVWFRFGGRIVLQHYSLRFVLWRTGTAPLRYVRFLDEAAERLLLRKVGGGYVFIHRLIQDYFASPGTPPQADSGAKANK